MDHIYEEISAFLKKKPSHIFSEIISGVIDSSSSGYPVLIIDTKNNLKLWAQSIKLCFPEKTINSLVFEELCLDKNNNKLLIIRPLVKTEEELYTNVFTRTFDFKNNEFCSVRKNFKFARLVEYGLLSSRELMESMRGLLSSFSYTCIGEDIEGFTQLFLLINGQEQESANCEAVSQALEFINRYGSPDAMGEIYTRFQVYVQGIIKGTAKEQLKAAAVFASKALGSLGNSISIESAGGMFFDSFDSLLLEETGCTSQEAYQLFSPLLPDNEEIRTQLYEFFINSGRLEIMEGLIRKHQYTHRAEFYIKIISEALHSLNYSWEEAEKLPCMGTLMNYCGCIISDYPDGMGFVMKGLNGEIGIGILMTLFNRIHSKESMDRLVEAFVHYIDLLTIEEQRNSRQSVCAKGGARLIYEEFLIRLEASKNKQELFHRWRREVFQRSEELSRGYYSPAIKAYLKNFKSPRKLFEQCEMLMKGLGEDEQYIDFDTCELLINGIENGLPLDGTMSDRKQLIEHTRRLKEEFSIKTVPDMLHFSDVGLWLEATGGDGYSLNTILEGMPSIMFLRGDRLRHYQDWCVPVLIPLVKTPEDHRSLVYAFRAGEDVHEFYQRYIRFVCDFMEKDKLNGYNVFLQFVVYFFYYLKAEYRLYDGKYTIQAAGEMMREAIYSQPSIFRKRLDMDVRRELRARRLKVPALWVEIIKPRSAAPKKGVVARLRVSLVKRRRKK